MTGTWVKLGFSKVFHECQSGSRAFPTGPNQKGKDGVLETSDQGLLVGKVDWSLAANENLSNQKGISSQL